MRLLSKYEVGDGSDTSANGTQYHYPGHTSAGHRRAKEIEAISNEAWRRTVDEEHSGHDITLQTAANRVAGGQKELPRGIVSNSLKGLSKCVIICIIY